MTGHERRLRSQLLPRLAAETGADYQEKDASTHEEGVEGRKWAKEEEGGEGR